MSTQNDVVFYEPKKNYCYSCFLFWLLDFSKTSWLPPPTRLTHCPSFISSQHFIFITLLSLNYFLINEYSKFIQIQFRFPFYSPNCVFNPQRQRYSFSYFRFLSSLILWFVFTLFVSIIALFVNPFHFMYYFLCI